MNLFCKKNNNYRFYFFSILFLLFLFYVRSILLPFILGLLIAYLFKGIVEKYENKCSRQTLSFIVSAWCMFVIALLIFIALPILCNQVFDLTKYVINYLNKINLQNLIEQISLDISTKYKIAEAEEIASFINENIKYLYENCLKYLGNLSNYILSYSVKFVNTISMIILSPIMGFYFLRDWNKIICNIKYMIPSDIRKSSNELFIKIDEVLHNFFVSELIVCGICSIYYSLILSIIGLKYGFIIGLISGALNCIPYIGSTLSCGIGLIVGAIQYGFNIPRLCLIAGVFSLGFFLEGNFLTPTVVSDKIKIHPLWILFSLFVGGKISGFWGLLLSLPIAGVIGVIIRFYLNKRKSFLCLVKQRMQRDL